MAIVNKVRDQAKKEVKKARSTWYIWLFPLFAILLAGWLFRGYFKQRGPVIEISFEDASSIQPEKTRVRYRGVTIGVVKEIELADNNKSVVARVQLQRDAEAFAVKGSKFWIVSPKVGIQGITGLETIFEGTYIAVQPGPEDADEELSFNGKLVNDSNESLENTRAFTLESPSLESVSSGDNVTFRGLSIGIVTNVTLSKNGQLGLVQINIQNKYRHLVRTNTVFWRKVGVQAKLGLFGSEIKVNSMDSILHGGVELFTPDPPGEIAKGGTKFALLAAAPKGSEKWNPSLE